MHMYIYIYTYIHIYICIGHMTLKTAPSLEPVMVAASPTEADPI